MSPSEWANNLLLDEKFLEVFKDLRQVQVDRIVNSNEHDIQEREAAYTKLNAIQDVYNHIVSIADQRKINEKRWKIF
jgi:predicted phosphoribosyltransferase